MGNILSLEVQHARPPAHLSFEYNVGKNRAYPKWSKGLN